MGTYDRLRTDANGNLLADGGKTVVPQDGGGEKAVLRQAEGWAFIPSTANGPFDVCIRGADGMLHIVGQGVGNAAKGFFTGVRVKMMAVKNMPRPKKRQEEA